MSAANAKHNYREGARAALLRVKLSNVDWTSANPLRWFEATAPHAERAGRAVADAVSSARAAAPTVGRVALGAGALYALAKALQAAANIRTPQNDPVPQGNLEDYLRSTL